MARILLVLASIAVTVYAIADWVSRSKTWTPGRINRWVWLAVIIFIPLLGPLAWIITGWVTRAESNRGHYQAPQPQAPMRPDDNPHGVSDVADRIARREKRTKPPRQKRDEDDGTSKDPKKGPAG